MKNLNSEKIVLVTGGSGFIGVHCIIQLLNAGYLVRTTLRSLKREAEVRAMVKEGGADAGGRLSFITADLGADTGWLNAVTGCEYVIHVASPTPAGVYNHEDEMIIPARDGVLRVLRAARDTGVKRVVLTSAFGAIGFGHKPQTKAFNETNWTDLSAEVPAYQKSKTMAEMAAWDFIASEGGQLELSVVNPVAVLGPVLGPDFSHSIQMIKRMMNGEMAGCPKLNSGFVDVRDVADLHLRAMTHPAAKGERFLAISGESIWMLEIAKVLKARLGAAADNVPSKELPNWVIRIAVMRNPILKLIVPMLGKVMNATSEKAERLLGWSPRSAEDAIVATAESLVKLGLVIPKK